MKHHNYISTPGQRRCLTGFLVSAIAPVAIVSDRRDAQVLRHLDRGVVAGIVGRDDIINNLARYFINGLFEPVRGVVGRQHYRDFLVRED